MSSKEGENSPKKIDIKYVEQNYTFAHQEKWVQKSFMIVMGFFLILGLFGLFGSGFISETIHTATLLISNTKSFYGKIRRRISI